MTGVSTQRDQAESGDNPRRGTPDAGGFTQAAALLEFDQVQENLASYTRTKLGGQRARELAPASDVLDIATRQQETSEARRYLDQSGGLEFGPDADLQEHIQRALLGGLLRGPELRAIQLFVEAGRSNRATLLRHDDLPLMSGIADNMPVLGDLAREIFTSVSASGELLDDASPALRELRQESRAAYNRLNDTMERSLRRFQRQELVQEPIITQRNGRLVLLIKADMRSRVPGIVHDVSDSGATVFVEPMPAIEQGNRWREVRRAEEREEERVLRHLSTLVSDAGEDLLLLLDLMARLDLDMAKGAYSRALGAVEPWVTGAGSGGDNRDWEGRQLLLTSARHPLLTGEVVPISLHLGGGEQVMLITGPNAGGKTVALKTVGLLALMAHAGLHVPAQQARFPNLDGIFADIGDQQSIEQSLSTFSSHITNILSIMGKATGRSLVLLDELGTSTDPEEGSALAKSILDHFRQVGLLLVATTHHRGVARFVQEQAGMVNASVDLHPQSLEPTYRITQGLPGRSYALIIAGRLGMPNAIVQQARSDLSPVEQATESLLGELQREKVVVEGLRREAEASLAVAKEQQAKTEAELASVESTKLDLVEQARQELRDKTSMLLEQLQDAERELQRVRQQGRERKEPEEGTAAPLREQTQGLDRVRRELTDPQWQPIEVVRPEWYAGIAAGDRVYIRGIARPVEVVAGPDEQGEIGVLLGTMKARVPVYQLERPAQDSSPSAQEQDYSVARNAARRPPGQVDLRGLRVDEALARVEGLLNDAALDQAGEVRIIHGKGTGALRRAVRGHLEGHPLVADSSPGEGPAGTG